MNALSRRAFLRSAGLSASLAVMARLAPLPASGAPLPEAARRLAPDEIEILTQVVERLVDSDDPRAPAVRKTRAIATIEWTLGQLAPELTADLALALRLFEWGPAVFDFTFSRFTVMSAPEQDAAIRHWMHSRLALRRLVYSALRNLAFIGYYSQDAVWPAVGYRGPLLGAQPARTPPA